MSTPLGSRMLPWKELEGQNKPSKQAEEPDKKPLYLARILLL